MLSPGLNNPERHVLTHNRIITYLVLIFSDINKTQIFKTPNTKSLHREIEIIMSFKYLKLFNPNEHTEDYYNRGPNDKFFPFEMEDRKNVYVKTKYLILKRVIR